VDKREVSGPKEALTKGEDPEVLVKDDNSDPESRITDKGKETFEETVEITDAEDEEVTMADVRTSTMS
jgi:hypothetical protein